MSEEPKIQTQSDIAEALRVLLSYINNKGQLIPLDKLILYMVFSNALEREYGIKLLDLNDLVLKSINAPAFAKPLWVEALTQLAKLNTKTEVITQLNKRKILE